MCRREEQMTLVLFVSVLKKNMNFRRRDIYPPSRRSSLVIVSADPSDGWRCGTMRIPDQIIEYENSENSSAYGKHFAKLFEIFENIVTGFGVRLLHFGGRIPI